MWLKIKKKWLSIGMQTCTHTHTHILTQGIHTHIHTYTNIHTYRCEWRQRKTSVHRHANWCQFTFTANYSREITDRYNLISGGKDKFVFFFGAEMSALCVWSSACTGWVMCVCLCVCMYVCMYVYIYMHMYMCVCIYIYNINPIKTCAALAALSWFLPEAWTNTRAKFLAGRNWLLLI
jgi:hypothetical protein